MTAEAPSDRDDPQELARQFLDLWQRQVSLMAGEGGLADAFALMVDLMAGRHADRSDTNGAAAAAAAPGERGGDRGELLRRLAACEARIDRLERQLARRGAKPVGKARRRRT
jgi:hypothetical protein